MCDNENEVLFFEIFVIFKSVWSLREKWDDSRSFTSFFTVEDERKEINAIKREDVNVKMCFLEEERFFCRDGDKVG